MSTFDDFMIGEAADLSQQLRTAIAQRNEARTALKRCIGDLRSTMLIMNDEARVLTQSLIAEYEEVLKRVTV
jgi:hypothetical protein